MAAIQCDLLVSEGESRDRTEEPHSLKYDQFILIKGFKVVVMKQFQSLPFRGRWLPLS